MLLAECGLGAGCTVHQTGRLLGGKPVKVKIITNHLSCGQEVIIDLDPNAGKAEIKRKLETATGVPASQQKVMLSGINQIVMGDRRWVRSLEHGCSMGGGQPNKLYQVHAPIQLARGPRAAGPTSTLLPAALRTAWRLLSTPSPPSRIAELLPRRPDTA